MDRENIVLETIATRVSVRKFTEEKITEDEIKKILAAGQRAPSGENAQPWRFIVIEDEQVKNKLGYICRLGSGRRFTAEFAMKQMQKRFEDLLDNEKRNAVFKKLTSGMVSAFVASAPLIIVVVGKKEVWDTPYDCSAAIENMLIAAHAMGLGTCWVEAATMDVRDEIIVNKILGIPEEYKTISFIAVGRKVAERNVRKRLPIEQLAYKEKFGIPYWGGE